MYSIGEGIDGKYKVVDVCSDAGGMGTILHVESIKKEYPHSIVLKYCKETDSESITRFKREVRYLAGFSGNSLIVQILDSNLNDDPPYFVMKFYTEGDLFGLSDKINGNIEFQEEIFNKMLDCVHELHASGFHHRDIKPQNFLVEGKNIVISDLGLAKEIGAGTTFTMSHEYWGTYGYMPPEFHSGGFKTSTSPSDIFMLGKTFYSLLTGRDPLYISDTGIHPALYHVIQRCCDIKPQHRYSTIADLRQDITLAYDVILERAKGISGARQILSQIDSRLNNEGKYIETEIKDFLGLLAKLPEDERNSIIYDLPDKFYNVLAQDPIDPKLDKFLEQYEIFVKNAVVTWSYAETVAKNMRIIFSKSRNINQRVKALEIAIQGAIWANRFAAMDTCHEMIASVSDDDLGVAVSPLIGKFRGSFVVDIEISRCNNDVIVNALRVARKAASK